MLPRVHPQQDVEVRPAVREFAFLAGEERRAAEGAGGHHGVVVLLLSPVVRARQGGAGDVGREDRELVFKHIRVAVLVPDEPDEAGAEHGVGGRDEGFLERFEGGEGLVDMGREGGRHFGGGRGEGGEELVVGPGHAGVVEEGGGEGLTRVGDDEIFGGRVLIRGVWAMELAGVGD